MAQKNQNQNVGGRALPQQRPTEAGATCQTVPPLAVSVGHQDELLTKEEVGAKLKIDVRTVERWQRAGYIPHFKVGHFVLFHWPDVLQHLKTNHRFVGATPAGSSDAPTSPSGKEQAR